jgi:hypothetical protein
VQRLRNIGLAGLGRNCQRGEAYGLRLFRKLFEFPECWLQPGNGPGLTDVRQPLSRAIHTAICCQM